MGYNIVEMHHQTLTNPMTRICVETRALLGSSADFRLCMNVLLIMLITSCSLPFADQGLLWVLGARSIYAARFYCSMVTEAETTVAEVQIFLVLHLRVKRYCTYERRARPLRP